MNKNISYKNININFSVEGSGSAIVLLHGFLEDISMWKTVTEELVLRYKVIRIDLLGHGKTDVLGYLHSMEEMAEVVKTVLKSQRIRKATIIGHSMGGYVALAFAEKYSEYLKGFCLMNSTAQTDTNDRKELRLRAIKMAQTNYNALVSMSITNLFVQEIRKNILKEIEESKIIGLKTPAEGYVACSEGMRIRKNRESVLKQISVKKLMIIGEKDSVLNYTSIIKEAKRNNTPIKVFSNGHMSHIENPKELLETIKSFLRKK